MNRIQKTISHQDVQAALAKFRKEGGSITQLPAQVQPSSALVGGRWNGYESFFGAVPCLGAADMENMSPREMDAGREWTSTEMTAREN